MYELFVWNIYIVLFFFELHELSCGLLSGFDGISNLFGMSRWRLLRINGSHSCDGKLPIGILLRNICDSMLKLPRWFLPSDCGFFKLYGMSSGIVLRVDGIDCRDRCLCSWEILVRIFNRLLELLIRIIYIGCIIDKLLELSCGLFSGLDGIHCLCGLSCGFILRDNGSHSCNG